LLEVAVVEAEDLEQATQQRKAEELPLKGLPGDRDLTQLVVGRVEAEWVRLVKAFLTQIIKVETEVLDFNTQHLDHPFIMLEEEAGELIMPQTMAQEDLEEEEQAGDILEAELRQLLELQIQAEAEAVVEHLAQHCMRLEMADLES
jgi:hypothetical protein